MMTIKVFSTQSSNLAQQNILSGAGCKFIEIHDQPFGGGGQGSIYQVERINGQKPPEELCVKIFYGKVPAGLRDIIEVVGKDPRLGQCQALQALPLFLFEGEVEQPGASLPKPCEGYLMRKVRGESLKDLIDTPEYTNCGLETKLRLCIQFAEGMSLLTRYYILHGDLWFDNVLINLHHERLFLIDLDGGVVTTHQKVAHTVKDQCDTIAPEVYEQLIAGSKMVAIDRFAEYWSVAAMIHCLLFRAGPFFFLEDFRSIATYLQNYTWPQLRNLQNVRTCNDAYFDIYESTHQALPQPLQRCLQQAFQKGYFQRDQRPTPEQWHVNLQRALAQMRAPRVPPPQLEIVGSKSRTIVFRIGSSYSDEVVIRNAGGQNLHVTISPVRIPFFQVRLSTVQFTLTPGSTKKVAFVIEAGHPPPQAGRYRVTLFIESNGGQEQIVIEITVKRQRSRKALAFFAMFLMLSAALLSYTLSSKTELPTGISSPSIPRQCQQLISEGEWLINQGMYAKATETLTQAIACAPRSIRAHYYRAEAYYRLKDYEKALRDLNQCLEIDPNRPQVHYARGRCFLALGNCNGARKEYEFLSKLSSEDAQSLARDLLREIGEHCNTRR